MPSKNLLVEYDGEQYFRNVDMINNKWNCPVAICTYNRPVYLDKCLQAISNFYKIEDEKIPVYVFCDGVDDTTREKNITIIEKYQCVIKTFYQTKNLCIARHIHYMREMMFDKLNFNRLIFFEDDIVPSPYYYQYMNRLFDLFEKNDKTVGAINSCSICFLPLTEKIIYMNHFSDTLSHLNNYVMSKNTWIAIKPMMQEYIDTFLSPGDDYRTINHDGVLQWLQKKISRTNYNLLDIIKIKTTMSYLTSSQDSVTNVAMRVNNLRYLSTLVNRVLNIGEIGYHFEKEDYIARDFDKISLDIFPEDLLKINNIYIDQVEGIFQNIVSI